MSPLQARVQLERIHCFDEGDSIGTAEPYLWAVFFKIDGTTAFVNDAFKLEGTANTFNSLGNHGNLGTTDVDAGDDISIPQQFGYGDNFIPIPLRVPIGGTSEKPWVTGCVVVLMEQDNTAESAVDQGRSMLRIAVQDALDQVIPTLGFGHETPTPEEIEALKTQVTDRVTSAVKDHVSLFDVIFGGGINRDDVIGNEVFIFTQADFTSAGPAPINFGERWHDEGDWEIFGRAWVEWSEWKNLGGSLTAAPAVASRDHTHLDLFIRGGDNHMWHRSGDGSNFGNWTDLGGPPGEPIVSGDAHDPSTVLVSTAGPGGGIVGTPVELTSAPAAVSWGPNRIDTFARGKFGHMWHKWWDGATWSGWEDLGGDLSSAVAVSSRQENRLDCFVRGPSDHLWHKWWNGSFWSNWEDLGGNLTSGPAAVAWGPHRLDVFVRGPGNSLWHKWWDEGSNWSDWEDLGGTLSAAPAVASRGEGLLDCFVRGAENNLWCLSFNGSGWNPWLNLGGGLSEAPAAIARGKDRIDCFVRGGENNLWQKSWGPDHLAQ